jgi:hypothetical protein
MTLTGETFYEKTKGKDVRTSNILAAKVGILNSIHLHLISI